MISRIYKFPLRTEFLSFRAKSKKFSSSSFTAYYLPRSSHSRSEKPNITLRECNSRLSVVLPKKVNKLATTRNWLKRLIYDHLYPQISGKNLDAVIVFKPLALTKSLTTKEKILSEILKLKFEN